MLLPFMNQKILIISLFLLVFAPSAFSEDRQLVDRVAAVVNKEVITQSEFDTIFRPVYEQLVKAYQGPHLESELEKLRLQLLNQLIEDRLVYQEAQKLGITVDESEIQEELNSFKSQFPDQTRFENEMEKAGIKLTDLEKRIRERLSISKLHQALIHGKVVVSPTEVEQYYQDHPDEFSQKEEVKVWCITLRKGEEAIKKGTTDESVKRKAGLLIAQLKQGADFETLAKENSQDSHAQQGGYIGFVQRNQMVSSIDQVLFSLPEGSLSDVLETENNYHIFKIGEKRKASHRTFEEARDEIADKLYRQKAHERFVSWMDDLKKKSFISIR